MYLQMHLNVGQSLRYKEFQDVGSIQHSIKHISTSEIFPQTNISSFLILNVHKNYFRIFVIKNKTK